VKAWAHELVNFVAQYRSRKEVIRSSYERRVDLARIVRLLAVPVLLLAFASSCSIGNIKSDERDGEATVYDLGDFSGDFDLAYAVSFEPAPANQSWTVVTILLLSRTQSSSAVSVGLARGYPDATTLSGFTTSNRSRETSKYQSYPVRCNVCMVELRGDKATLTALLDGHKVGTWPRRVFSPHSPDGSGKRHLMESPSNCLTGVAHGESRLRVDPPSSLPERGYRDESPPAVRLPRDCRPHG